MNTERISLSVFEIPHQQLSDAALSGVIEEYVTREGTDYGHQEYSLADKVAAVRRQLERGDVVILFDADMQSCTLVTKAYAWS